MVRKDTKHHLFEAFIPKIVVLFYHYRGMIF
jgi:hypothetical protein